MINLADYPPIMTVAQTMKLLNIGRGKVYDMIKAKEIPSYRLRGSLRIPRDELLQKLEQQSHE